MKINYLNLAGKKYPLTFSLYASEQLSNLYKDEKQLERAIKNPKVPLATKTKLLSNVIGVLMKSGCEYCNEFNVPVYENAPIEEGAYIPLSPKQISLVIIPTEIELKRIMNVITATKGISEQKEIKAVAPRTKSRHKSVKKK